MDEEHEQQKTKNIHAEFNLQVVKMIREQGLGVIEVYRDVELGETSPHRWLAQADSALASRSPSSSNASASLRRRKKLRGDVNR